MTTDTRPTADSAAVLDPLLSAVRAGVRIFDLGRQLTVGMPQSPNHPAYWHSLPRRHGDMVRADGGSAANDMITMGTHVGTHIDALSHVSQDGRLHGGIHVEDALQGGRYVQLGAHTIEPMVRRGVLLDVPAAKGVARLDPGYEITVADLESAVDRQGTGIEAGDVVLVRSGWGQHFDSGEKALFMGQSSGVPGVSTAGATWLAGKRIHATGADTIAYECLPQGAGHALLPAHRVLLVEHGIYIIETLDLEQLAREAVHEFVFVLSALPFFGATGSPVRPLAVVSNA